MLQNILHNVMTNKYFFIILGTSFLFLLLAYYIYRSYIVPRLNATYVENKEILHTSPEKEAELFLFYADWCPACKKAKPEWNKLKDAYENQLVNNTKIHFRDVNGEKEPELMDKFGISEYPTIKLMKDNQVIEYDANPKFDTLVEFLHTTL